MWLTNWLDVIASGLVLAGLVWGGLTLVRARSRLQREADAAEQIHRESQAARELGEKYDTRAEERKRGVRRALTFNDMVTFEQDVELMIVDYLRPQLKWPFGLAFLGTLFGFLRALLLVCGVRS
ncbi:hypothetical protein [Microlunatus sp. Gsoil 973]|uniref:hypothetical protein n=1 Tax=Microlunatus sp. Gsoil 973 TaxID=2672569 RepID=UPI0012B4B8A7|nr:hypothetical protein [Microlunatus sp. Gsoil 973]QGN31697.1 hypothetical protein GJV80_01395 [Microlunatus sp. Gsoil 973]